jgi:sialic acid synthase SpsE
MQIRKQRLSAAQPSDFLRLRFLDLDDQVRLFKNLSRGLYDHGADTSIVIVIEALALGSTCLDEHIMAVRNDFANRSR